MENSKNTEIMGFELVVCNTESNPTPLSHAVQEVEQLNKKELGFSNAYTYTYVLIKRKIIILQNIQNRCSWK